MASSQPRCIRLSDDDYKILKDKADSDHRSVASLIRLMIAKGAFND